MELKNLKPTATDSLSAEAEIVLRQMQRKHRLIGSVFKRGSPFELEFQHGSEQVPFTIAMELIDQGYIVAIAAHGTDNAEYGLRNPPAD